RKISLPSFAVITNEVKDRSTDARSVNNDWPIRMIGSAIVRSLGPSRTGIVFAPRADTHCEFDPASSCELPQEAQIVLREQTDIGNVEQNHGQPVHPKTEGKPGPFFRIVSVVAAGSVDRFKNGGMHHSAAADFDPLFAAFQCARFNINFKTRFGERKIMRTKTDGGVGAKKLAQKEFQCAF